MLITQQGSSSTYIGLLSKDETLKVMEDPESISVSRAKHLSGGSWKNHLMNAVHWVRDRLPDVNNFLGKVDHPVAQTAHKVLDAVGYGMTGAAKHKLHDRLH